MTHLLKGITMLLFFSMLYSCGNTSNGETAKSGVQNNKNKTIAGTVISTSYGKDGYTADVHTVESGDYAALVSIINVGGPDNYQVVKKGDKVIFKGIPSTSTGEQRLIVEKIIKVESTQTASATDTNVEAAKLNEQYSAITADEYCWLAMKKIELRNAPSTTAQIEGPHFQGEVLKVLDSKMINNELWVNVQFTLQVKTGYEDQFADGQVMSTGSSTGWIGGIIMPLIRCK